MSEHKISLTWRRESPDFSYQNYNREHLVHFKNGKTMEVSAAAQFLGKPGFIDPEEMLVAAYSSCHMLTFLAITARKRLVVDSYEDAAVGYLEKNSVGKLAITRIELSPNIVFASDTPSPEELKKMHERSHEECFIANSCNIIGTVRER